MKSDMYHHKIKKRKNLKGGQEAIVKSCSKVNSKWVKRKNTLNNHSNTGRGYPERLGKVGIFGDFQRAVGQGPEKPHLSLKLAFC